MWKQRQSPGNINPKGFQLCAGLETGIGKVRDWEPDCTLMGVPTFSVLYELQYQYFADLE